MNNITEEYQRDAQLREKARVIVNFKMHRSVFLLANLLIWLVSALLFFAFELLWEWAIFPTAIWLIILIFHYLWVFRWNKDRVEKVYQELKKDKEKKDAGDLNPLEVPESKKENQNTL